MRPTRPSALRRILSPAPGGDRRAPEDGWSERAGRLYVDLEQPARAMVRRAFRGAFSDDELDDVYAGAWVGTLRALARRHAELSDDQIRRYLLAAVANQASKELRRRRRKPTTPLELVDTVADDSTPPDERAVGAERARIARDLLASLPPRTRAVMLLRYGWGLEPAQVCELVRLSPRAYRKEVTRGVDQLTERMRRVERGEWCAERGTVLKAYAAGLADAEERRQAETHLAHCRDCEGFVARLRGRLHDIGAGLALPIAFDALHAQASLAGRIGDLGERGRELLGTFLSRGGSEAFNEATGGLTAGGGTRGVFSAATAGVLAKVSGLGTAGKVVAVCITGGAVATACVSTGAVAGLGAGGSAGDRERTAPREPAPTSDEPGESPAPRPIPGAPAPLPQESPAARGDDGPAGEGTSGSSGTAGTRASASPAELEFGISSAGTGTQSSDPLDLADDDRGGGGSGGGEFGTGGGGGASTGRSGGGGASAGGREFGGP